MGDRTYIARVRRESDHWSLNIHGLNGARAHLVTLDRLDEAVRDVIALVLNVPVDSFDVGIEINDVADRPC